MITSVDQIIDLETIAGGCNIINAAAKDFTTCANHLTAASEACTPKALSVDNTSMQGVIAEVAAATTALESNITGATAEVLSAAQALYNAQWASYNEYLRQQELAKNANQVNQ